MPGRGLPAGLLKYQVQILQKKTLMINDNDNGDKDDDDDDDDDDDNDDNDDEVIKT